MKTKIALTLIIIMSLLTTSFAQKGEKKEERKAKKIAFITERLALTPEESKAFWPLYEERNKAKKEAIKAIKGTKKNTPKKKIEDMTDEEVIALLDRTLKIKQARLDIQKEYNKKFLEVLPPKKVALLYHIEKEFRKQTKNNS